MRGNGETNTPYPDRASGRMWDREAPSEDKEKGEGWGKIAPGDLRPIFSLKRWRKGTCAVPSLFPSPPPPPSPHVAQKGAREGRTAGVQIRRLYVVRVKTNVSTEKGGA